MSSDAARASGEYAQDRYQRGLRSWRRRTRFPLLVRLTPIAVTAVGVAVVFKSAVVSFTAGVMVGICLMTFIVIRDLPPRHVLNWGRGAEGERWTAKELAPLARYGWTVEHDLQRPRGNRDHVVHGPSGIYLIETKHLAGRVTVENGVLTTRQLDDDEEVYRNERLAKRMRAEAAALADEIGARERRRRWVQPVVTIWGDFGEGFVEADGVVYLGGAQLRSWLLQREGANG
jgi:hypothetical protein